MPMDSTNGLDQEARTVWYCIDCHRPTALEDTMIRTVSGKCLCLRCWQLDREVHPLDASDLAWAQRMAGT